MISDHVPRYVLVLAAGKGTRMGSTDTHKVCFRVDGRPVINRALEIYRASGIQQPIVVVGSLAVQVMETIAQQDQQVLYVYQPEQRGTGDAACLGVTAIEGLGSAVDDDLLLVAGDRIVDPQALSQLYDLYYTQACDLAFLAAERTPASEQGRVALGADGQVLGIVEMRDVWQRQAVAALREALAQNGDVPRARALAILLAHMDEARARVTFGPLWERLQTAASLSSRELDEYLAVPVDFSWPASDSTPLHMPPAAVNDLQLVNVSVYLGRVSALRWALERLSTDNAQHEVYLSDIVNLLVADGRRVRVQRVRDPHQVLGYNNPAELLAVENYYRARKEAQSTPALFAGVFQPISEWLQALSACSFSGPAVQQSLTAQTLVQIYGDGIELLSERRQAYIDLLEHSRSYLPSDAAVALVRSPGRANILGRHVDHQGGHCNLLAIDREILVVVQPRQDDIVTLHNVGGALFQDQRFTISELLQQIPWDDWTSLVNSQTVLEMVKSANGDWGQYVRAAVLRLQKRYPDRALRGMDLVVYGNIPIASGLSSSSALVVAAAEACVAVNALDIQPAQFVDLCGEGEWYVGTRGGSADHAAIKLSQPGQVTQVSFFPFAVNRMVAFPPTHRLVVCNSGIQARKAAGARDIFNQRVACYRLGLMLIKKHYPQFAPLFHHLRDVNIRTLGLPLEWIYRILLSLPERASSTYLAAELEHEVIAPILATHQPPEDGYPIRGVVLYGLAECERSRLGVDLLDTGQVKAFGQAMTVSHNGDRVVRHAPDGRELPYHAPTDDAYLKALIVASAAPDPLIAQAQLELQPGSYRCSTPEIDQMVDLALQVPGVAGAQLAGAGLGGCMMVLARSEAVAALRQTLSQGYYSPRGLTPDISVCTPIAGSGLLSSS